MISFIPAIAQDTWVQKANFPDTSRNNIATFSIGNKIYLVGGFLSNSTNTNDVWEYTPATNVWIQKANFPGYPARSEAVGFSIGNYGYVGLGGTGVGTKKDFWRYDPANDHWTKIADFPGGNRRTAVAFTAAGKGYVGTGFSNFLNNGKKDFYSYDPVTNEWTQIPDFPDNATGRAVAFSISDKGYVGLGSDYGSSFNPNIWEYDPDTNMWQQKTAFPGATTGLWFSFSLEDKGYIGTGLNSSLVQSASQVYEYDPVADSWTQKNDFAGGARINATAVANGNHAYAGLGHDSVTTNVGSYLVDWWEYSPSCAGYAEICGNGVDDNCNGLIDENCCMAPGVLATFNITANSARLNWNMVPTATKYKVSYKRDSSGAAWITETVTAPSLEITGLLPSSKYKWKVKSVCNTLKSAFSTIEKFTTMPLRLMQATNGAEPQVYPNPVHDHATVSFEQTVTENVKLEITDLSGKNIMEMVNQTLQPGQQTFIFNTAELPAGLYLLQLKTAGTVFTKKITVDH
ncbi:MAG: kelch repeat-containing protein [Chitinophagales bacterium]